LHVAKKRPNEKNKIDYAFYNFMGDLLLVKGEENLNAEKLSLLRNLRIYLPRML
jgi:hypothetical protein